MKTERALDECGETDRLPCGIPTTAPPEILGCGSKCRHFDPQPKMSASPRAVRGESESRGLLSRVLPGLLVLHHTVSGAESCWRGMLPQDPNGRLMGTA